MDAECGLDLAQRLNCSRQRRIKSGYDIRYLLQVTGTVRAVLAHQLITLLGRAVNGSLNLIRLHVDVTLGEPLRRAIERANLCASGPLNFSEKVP